MAHFARMVDMAKTPEEVNKEVDQMKPGAPTSVIAENIAKYPYGLCITLEDDQLEKLEIDGACEVGDMIHLCAIAKVTSCNARETEGGKQPKRRIELQITHLATENEDSEDDAAERAKRRYGGEDETA